MSENNPAQHACMEFKCFVAHVGGISSLQINSKLMNPIDIKGDYRILQKITSSPSKDSSTNDKEKLFTLSRNPTKR